METKPKFKRYTKKKESQMNIRRNINEMVAMLKNETIKEKIQFSKLKMTNHAKFRAKERFNVGSELEAIRNVKRILRKATRVGEQMAFDGRINVLYVFKQTAVYLSPCLEYVISINTMGDISYKPIAKQLPTLTQMFEGEDLKRKLLNLHKSAWREIEAEERELEQRVLDVMEDVDVKIAELKEKRKNVETKEQSLLIKEKISNQVYRNKKVQKDLFHVKIQKRHVGKSITALL